MQKSKIKAGIYILAFFFSFAAIFAFAAPVFAADGGDEKELLKVYSSEPIGAGEKVYHINVCKKAQSYAPLRCSKDTQDIAPQQCVKEEKLQDGAYIKGCITAGPDNEEGIAPQVDPDGYTKTKANNGCSDDAAKQGYYYAPEYAIVDGVGITTYNLDETKWTIKATIAWPEDYKDELDTVIEKMYPGTGFTPMQLYRPTLCTKFDILDEGGDRSAGGLLEPETQELEVRDQMQLTREEQDLLDKIAVTPVNDAMNLVDAGCNNDNSTQDIPGLERSTPFNASPSYTCSIKERITGTSGADIFGKYISAIYKWAAGVVGIVAVLTFVYSGIQISAAGGDSAKVDTAKNRIMKTIIGLAIFFLASLILYTINPGFFIG